MAYQMAATAVDLDDVKGHSPFAGHFKCNSSKICAVFPCLTVHRCWREK